MNLAIHGIDAQIAHGDTFHNHQHPDLKADYVFAHGLAELRGLYGTGHGKHGRSTGLGVRHAKLAVGAAATLVIFLFETHKETRR